MEMKTLKSLRILTALTASWFAFTLVSLGHAATFTLQWDPNPEPDLAGYELHYGRASGAYSEITDVGNVTTSKLTGVEDGVTYYFAVVAYDTSGNRSDFSNEVSGRSNLPPQASAAASVASGEAPMSVSFSGTGSDADGTISAYSWQFGDGHTSAEQNPQHTYDIPGTYTATLTVTDNDGAPASASVSIQVLAANKPPVASAGANPTSGAPPLAVAFTASASDPDGAIASYRWDFGDGLSSSQPNPSHTYSVAGAYTATLTVTDNGGATARDVVKISVSKQPPRADAGPDQTVHEGARVTLDGSNSNDPDDIASYLWTQIEGPPVTLDDPEAIQTAFTAPDVDESGAALTFQLEVRDTGGLAATDACIVNVTWVNEPPKADAGPDQTADEGNIVILDGSKSYDPDDGIASHLWEQTEGPSVTLNDPSAAQSTFTAPAVGETGAALTFQLRVKDTGGLAATDACIVNVTWTNLPPIADAGPDQTADEGNIVILDGSKSYDPDDGIASYRWRQKAGPPVTLFDSDKAQPSFVVPDVEPDRDPLLFELTVADTKGLQSADECQAVIGTVNLGVDLTGSWVRLKKIQRRSNCWIKGTFRVQNLGPGAAPASSVIFYLSKDGRFDTSDAQVGENTIGPLEAQQSADLLLSTKLPYCFRTSYIIGVMHAGEAVADVDESNNIIVSRPLN
jgi:PKD repeat protein